MVVSQRRAHGCSVRRAARALRARRSGTARRASRTGRTRASVALGWTLGWTLAGTLGSWRALGWRRSSGGARAGAAAKPHLVLQVLLEVVRAVRPRVRRPVRRPVAVGRRVWPGAGVRTHARRRRGSRRRSGGSWWTGRAGRSLRRRRLRGRRRAARRSCLGTGRPRGGSVVGALAGDVVPGAAGAAGAHHAGGRALVHAGTAPTLVAELRVRHVVGDRPAGVGVALRPAGARAVVLVRTVLHVALRPGTIAAALWVLLALLRRVGWHLLRTGRHGGRHAGRHAWVGPHLVPVDVRRGRQGLLISALSGHW